MKKNKFNNISGLTLVEILIGIIMTSIMMAAIYTSYTVVNNSYELAKNYVQEIRNKVEADIVLIAFDVNKSKKFLNDNTEEYKRFLKTQKLIRRVDEIHIIDGQKKLLFSTLEDNDTYIPPLDQALNLVLDDDRPLKIINAFENKSAAIIKIPSIDNAFLYVVKSVSYTHLTLPTKRIV